MPQDHKNPTTRFFMADHPPSCPENNNIDVKKACDSAETALANGAAGLAETELRRSLAKTGRPSPRLCALLAEALRRQAKFSQATPWFKRAASAFPDAPRICWGLGLSLWRQGRDHEAGVYFARAARLDPERADHLYGAALCAEQAGERLQARALRDAAVQADPDLIQRLLTRHLWADALPWTRDRVEAGDDAMIDAHAECLFRLGRFDEAAEWLNSPRAAGTGADRFRQIMNWVRGASSDKARPAWPAELNLAAQFQAEPHIDPAPVMNDVIAAFDQRAHPAAAWRSIAAQRLWLGDPLAAVDDYDRYVRATGDQENGRQMGLALLLSQTTDNAWLRARVEEMNRLLFPNTPPRRLSPRPAERRVRVAYFCCHFHSPDARHIYGAMIANHDPQRFEVFLLSDGRDAVDAAEFYQRPDAVHWVDVSALDDQAFAQRALELDLDVLSDLDGPMSRRGPIIAGRLARVQVNWANWAMTTGLPAYDCVISDDRQLPLSHQPYYSETIRHMPQRGAFGFRRPPRVAEPPMKRAAHPMFGCFGSVGKVNRRALTLWADVLKAVPGAKMLVKNAFAGTRQGVAFYRDWFEKAGVAPDRLVLEGLSDYPIMLRRYDDVDIVLDTFPVSGGSSCSEPLSMGIPVITLKGDRWTARVGYKMLKLLDLEDLVADSEAAFVAIACRLAEDLPRLERLRAELPAQFRDSALADTRSIARSLEKVYLDALRDGGHLTPSDTGSPLV